jgi:hypothetical protein
MAYKTPQMVSQGPKPIPKPGVKGKLKSMQDFIVKPIKAYGVQPSATSTLTPKKAKAKPKPYGS